jgi:hydrogenase nickel incorporation protein HypA/HybF
MHELSIAMSIVDIATRQAEEASALSVSQVELDIGTMSGIEFGSLDFALQVAVKDTMLEGTEFRINRIEPLCECRTCRHLFEPDGFLSRCPECEGADTELIRGNELQIKSLLVEQKE